MIGQLLARRYQIIRVLGAGGFAQTYVAHDTHIPGNPTCVVKHLKPASHSPEFIKTARELFQREAETLVKLGKHDQIPQLLAYFEEDQEFYLVQEFIEGHTLAAELLSCERLLESQIIQLLEEILDILVFVHSEGVIHRDIKPDNIMRRDSDHKLVLIDFGAIKQVQNPVLNIPTQGQSVATSTRIGTPGYSPTEQDRGKPRACSDIYALGMVAIQALTGIEPSQFQEDDETGEILWQQQAQVSSGLAVILTKMVRYHFKDRYQSPEEVLRALEEWQNPSSKSTTSEKIVDRVTHSAYELVLEWVEAGKLKTQAISEDQPSKKPGTVSIGRDPAQCDIILPDPTVSGLHAEIFFNAEDKGFYLRSLRESNPPVVDEQSLPMGETVLHPGSNVQLGRTSLSVVAIELKPLTRGYKPTQMVIPQVNESLQPVAPTLQPPGVHTTSQNATVSSTAPPTTTTSKNKLPLLIGLGFAVLLSAGGGYAYLRGQSNNLTTADVSTANSDASVESSPTNPSTTNWNSANTLSPTQTPIPQSDASVKLSIPNTPIAQSDAANTVNPAETPTTKLDATAKSSTTDTSTTKLDAPEKSSATDTSTPKSDSAQPSPDEGASILAKATDKAKSGDILGAIAQAGQIPSSSSAYQQAQNAIAQWQQQQQQVARQEARNRATALLSNARDVAKKGGEGDMETAIGMAEDAMAEAPPNSFIYKEAQKAIAQWQKEVTTKQEQEATDSSSSYSCSCQLSDANAQKTTTSMESPRDLTGLSCDAPTGESEARVSGLWKCEKH